MISCSVRTNGHTNERVWRYEQLPDEGEIKTNNTETNIYT